MCAAIAVGGDAQDVGELVGRRRRIAGLAGFNPDVGDAAIDDDRLTGAVEDRGALRRQPGVLQGVTGGQRRLDRRGLPDNGPVAVGKSDVDLRRVAPHLVAGQLPGHREHRPRHVVVRRMGDGGGIDVHRSRLQPLHDGGVLTLHLGAGEASRKRHGRQVALAPGRRERLRQVVRWRCRNRTPRPTPHLVPLRRRHASSCGSASNRLPRRRSRAQSPARG